MERIHLSSNEVVDICRTVVHLRDIENAVLKSATTNNGAFIICEKIINAERMLIELVQNSETYEDEKEP